MPVLIFLLIVVPLVELFVIIEIGQLIGVWPTIGLLLASAILGGLMLRSQGRVVWARFNKALAERRVPHREVMDGALVIFGGALLLTPGFVTDVVGMLCLLPPSRAAIRGFVSKLFVGRVALGARGAYWGYGRVRDRRSANGSGNGEPRPGPTPRPGPSPRPSARPFDVEGTAHEIGNGEMIEPPPRESRP